MFLCRNFPYSTYHAAGPPFFSDFCLESIRKFSVFSSCFEFAISRDPPPTSQLSDVCTVLEHFHVRKSGNVTFSDDSIAISDFHFVLDPNVWKKHRVVGIEH